MVQSGRLQMKYKMAHALCMLDTATVVTRTCLNVTFVLTISFLKLICRLLLHVIHFDFQF